MRALILQRAIALKANYRADLAQSISPIVLEKYSPMLQVMEFTIRNGQLSIDGVEVSEADLSAALAIAQGKNDWTQSFEFRLGDRLVKLYDFNDGFRVTIDGSDMMPHGVASNLLLAVESGHSIFELQRSAFDFRRGESEYHIKAPMLSRNAPWEIAKAISHRYDLAIAELRKLSWDLGLGNFGGWSRENADTDRPQTQS